MSSPGPGDRPASRRALKGSLPSVKEKGLTSKSLIQFSVPEKKAGPDGKSTILQSFEAMHRQKNSLVSLFDSTQLPALSRVCVVRRLAEGEKMIREGEMATFLGFVMTGRLKVDLQGDQNNARIQLGPGDIVGEMELCQGDVGKFERKNTVEAVLASTVAQLSYDDFSSFVESLGSRMAKRVSKRIASVVLDRFVQNEQRADYEDRRRLATIGDRRRGALCMAPEHDISTIAPMIVHDKKSGVPELNLRNEVFDHGVSTRSSSINKASNKLKPDDLMRQALSSVLTRIGIFANMDPLLKEELLDCFYLYEPAGGEIVVATGDPQSLFFVIYRGSCGIYEIPKELVHRTFSSQPDGGESNSAANPNPMLTRLSSAEDGGRYFDESDSEVSPKGRKQPLPRGQDSDFAESPGGAVSPRHGPRGYNIGEGASLIPRPREISPKGRKLKSSPGDSDIGSGVKWKAGDAEPLEVSTPLKNGLPEMASFNLNGPAPHLGGSTGSLGKMSSNQGWPVDQVTGSFCDRQNSKQFIASSDDGDSDNRERGASLGKFGSTQALLVAPSRNNVLNFMMEKSRASLLGGGGPPTKGKKNLKKVEYQAVKTLFGGDCFNEFSLILDGDSPVTIRAMQRDVQLLVVDSRMFRTNRRAYEQERQTCIREGLLKTPWAKHLPQDMFNNLVDACEIKKFEAGSRIVSEWDEDANSYFYQVVSGSAVEVMEKKSPLDRIMGSLHNGQNSSRKSSKVDFLTSTSTPPARSRRFSSIQLDFEKTLKEYSKWDYFCEFVLETVSAEMDIAKVHLNPTIVAEHSCICLRLSRNVFRSIVGSLESFLPTVEPPVKKIERRSSVVGERLSMLDRLPSHSEGRSSGHERRSSIKERRPSSFERRSSVEGRPYAHPDEDSLSRTVSQIRATGDRSSVSPVDFGSLTPSLEHEVHRTLSTKNEGEDEDKLAGESQSIVETGVKSDTSGDDLQAYRKGVIQDEGGNSWTMTDAFAQVHSNGLPENDESGPAGGVLAETKNLPAEDEKSSTSNGVLTAIAESQQMFGSAGVFSPEVAESMSDDVMEARVSAKTWQAGNLPQLPGQNMALEITPDGVQGVETSDAQGQERHMSPEADGLEGVVTSYPEVQEQHVSPTNNNSNVGKEAAELQRDEMEMDDTDTRSAESKPATVSENSHLAHGVHAFGIPAETATQESNILSNSTPVTDAKKGGEFNHELGMEELGAVGSKDLGHAGSMEDGKGAAEVAADKDEVAAGKDDVVEMGVEEVMDAAEIKIEKVEDTFLTKKETGEQQQQQQQQEIGGKSRIEGDFLDLLQSEIQANDEEEIVHVEETSNCENSLGLGDLNGDIVGEMKEETGIHEAGNRTCSTDDADFDEKVHSENGSLTLPQEGKLPLASEAVQSDVLVLDDEDEDGEVKNDATGVENDQFETMWMTQEDGTASGEISTLVIGISTLDNVADLQQVAAEEESESFSRRSSHQAGGMWFPGSRPGTQSGRPKSQGFGSRPMTQGSSGPSSRPGTQGPLMDAGAWGSNFDPNQSRPNTVGSNRSLPRGENLMRPESSLPHFRSPAHTPSISSGSRVQSADPTQLNDRRNRASTILVAAADEFSIPYGMKVDPALRSDEDASSDEEDILAGGRPVHDHDKESSERVRISQDLENDKWDSQKAVKLPSMQHDGASRSGVRRSGTAASRAATAAMISEAGLRSQTAGSGQVFVRSTPGPGPGAYNVREHKGSGIRGGRWSMSDRDITPSTTSTPGPGEYNVVKTLKVLRLNQLRASTAMAAVNNFERDNSRSSLRSASDDDENEGLRLRRIQQEYSLKSREEVRLAREKREAFERAKRDAEFKKRRGSEMPKRPNTVYTSVIAKHWEGRGGIPPLELPDSINLAWELRGFEPVKRAYKDEGYEL